MTDTLHPSRLERELERERLQRQRNDAARTGDLSDDELRMKDARESSRSGQLHRNPAS